MTKVGTGVTTFAYDAAGIRVKTVHPGGKTSYFPFPGYEEEVNGSTTTRRITYAIAGQTVALRVQVVGGSNTLYYLHSDHLGSTSLATTTNGAVVAGSTARHLPVGGWRTTPTAGLTDIGFTGHLHNNLPGSDLWLIYMGARFYVPSIGLFASADTLVADPTNPQSYNRFSYVKNRPLVAVDPNGHCATDDQECWDFLNDVNPNDSFCADLDCGEEGWRRWINIFSPDGTSWTKEELLALRVALMATKLALQDSGQSNWLRMIGQFRFVRSNSPYGTHFDGTEINITSKMTFDTGRTHDAIFAILHEIGHAIDVNRDLGRKMLTNAGAKQSFLGDPVKSGFCFRAHACSKYTETWADAWAMSAIDNRPELFVAELGPGNFLPGGYVLLTGPLQGNNKSIGQAYNNGNYVKMLKAVSISLSGP